MKGEKAEYFYIIYLGEAVLKDNESTILKLSRGDIAGLESVQGKIYSSDCLSNTDRMLVFKGKVSDFYSSEIKILPFLLKLAETKDKIIESIKQKRKFLFSVRAAKKFEKFSKSETKRKSRQSALSPSEMNFTRFKPLESRKLGKINSIISSSNYSSGKTVAIMKKNLPRIIQRRVVPVKSSYASFQTEVKAMRKKTRRWQPSEELRDNLKNWRSFKKTEIFDTGMYELPLFTNFSVNASQ